jgi:tRNA threonylcarbamoyladenosine modification (KEOPS) complex  Pcc1 subunit
MTAAGRWEGRLRVARPDPASADRLLRALQPEAAREVPRARARLAREGEREIVLDIEAADTGALRAAVNTYLGWISLTERTERAAPP